MIKLLSALPWLVAAFGLLAGGGGALWYRGQYHACATAREADRTAAEKAKNEALADAQKRSDAIIVEQAQRLAETAQRANTVRERIIYAPVTKTCADSPAVRAAIDGVRTITGSPGGGDPQTRSGAPAAVPGPTGR